MVGPLGELGKEDPASAGPRPRNWGTRHQSTGHAQPRSHLTHLHSTQAKSFWHTPCASVYPIHPIMSTHALSGCENGFPLQHCFSEGCSAHV